MQETVVQAGTCLRRKSDSYHISDQKYNTVCLLSYNVYFNELSSQHPAIEQMTAVSFVWQSKPFSFK